MSSDPTKIEQQFTSLRMELVSIEILGRVIS